MAKDKQAYDGSTMLDSIQQETFTDKMLIFNQTESYIQSYPDCSSREVAKAAASRLLTNVNVLDRIAELKEDRLERTRFTQDEVLMEIYALGMANFFDYAEPVDGGGLEMKLKDQIPIEKQGAVKGVRIRRRIIEAQDDDSDELIVVDSMEYIMHDKTQPLKMLANHVGLKVDRMHLNGKLKVNGKMTIENLRDSHAKATGK